MTAPAEGPQLRPDGLPDPDEDGITAAEASRRILYVRHAALQSQHGHERIPYERFHGGSHSTMGDYSDEERLARWGLTPMSSRDPRERRAPGTRFLGRRPA